MKVLEKIGQKLEKWAHSFAFILFTWFEKEKQFCVLRYFSMPFVYRISRKKNVSLEKLRLLFYYCVADMEIWILLVCVSTTTIKMCKGGRKCGTTVLFCRVQSVCRICLVTNRIESRKVNEINWNELTTEWPFGRKLRKLGTLGPFRAFFFSHKNRKSPSLEYSTSWKNIARKCKCMLIEELPEIFIQ